ncbi:hypothetical protein [Chitinophaga japonensis]|uniref:Uncharacterized protein n=1 Tax=Chitinophaga japonensis TaxID=104662 RepID=A0A562SZN1_CHIJA|nr:hypothetical protein [Chitinophaga japonensis]TWI86286.1 hypothetical protein LX66_3540 [Chitinophaga japonensis]
MKQIVAFLLLAALSGCMTAGRVTGWLNDHPAASARYCADEYPVKTITTVTERVEHDTITVPGGQVVIHDTIPCPDGTSVPVQYEQPCPPVKVVTQTVYRDSVVKVENTAHVRALQADSAYFVRKANEATVRGDKWQKWAYYALAGVVLLAGWTFRNPILGLVKKLIA